MARYGISSAALILAVTLVWASPACAADTLEAVKLPRPDVDGGMPLMAALKNRQSVRSFSQREIEPRVLSNLMWAAFGINRPASQKRTAPSAVNWQEIDIYVATEKGVYIYRPGPHALEPYAAQDIRQYTGLQDFTQKAPVNLIYVADLSKMGGEEESKDFFAATDTGFISQNVYLFCASEGLATVVLAWADKPALAKIMDLRDDQKIILTQPVGYPE
jgi:SagB-type dehydrogenase family enzyme